MAKEVARTAADTTALALFSELKFDELNASIERIGQRSGTLSDKEKETGVKVLGDWEHNVIERLQGKLGKLRDMKSYIVEGQRNYGYGYDSTEYDKMREFLANLSGTNRQHADFLAARDALDAHETTKILHTSPNPELSEIQQTIEMQKLRVEQSKWDGEKRKLQYALEVVEKRWISTMRGTKAIKDLLSGIDGYSRRLKDYELEAKDKASLARLNIAIGDEEMRKAIREMVSFTKKLQV